MRNFYFIVICSVLLIAGLNQTLAQQCDPSVPVFNVDLTGNPGGSYTSPVTGRNGFCCSSSGSDVCVEFDVTLDPSSSGISFSIASGAIPPGALYYQVNCGPMTQVGTMICLNGVGPHVLTFCKPGGNTNSFQIQSIPKPSLNGTVLVSQACIGNMVAQGLYDSTITWTSVPSNPLYNSYLSCSQGCDSVTVTPSGAFPPYIDYRVCGDVIGGCSPVTWCDTLRINFVTNLAVNITPQNPVICFGSSGITLTANPSGGSAPYQYTWSNGATTQNAFVTAGTYTVTVQLTDVMSCSTAIDTVTVTALPAPNSANGGPDLNLCYGTRQSVLLSGSVNVATGGIWTNGGGTFTPSDTVLNTNYFPSAAEVTAGLAQLMLITTGNSGCPADTDLVRINILPQPVPQVTGNFSVCELTSATYTASCNTTVAYNWMVTGGSLISPNGNSTATILWNGSGSGSIRLTASNAFCDTAVIYPVTINPKPTPVILGPASVCVPAAAVFTLSNPGSNTHSWSVTGGTITGSSTGSSISVQWNSTGSGTVSVTETNGFGCDSSVTIPVTLNPQPYPQVNGNFSVCEKTSSTYIASCNVPASYQWSVSGGTFISPNGNSTITIRWNGSGNGSLTLTATHALGCDSTITVPVTINPKPTPVIAGSLSACVPTTSTFSLSVPNGNTHNWSVTGGTITGSSTGNTITVQWNSPGTGHVYVTETNGFGCDSTVTIPVSLNPQPSPQINGSFNVCENAPLTYIASCNVPASYQWGITGGNLISPNGSSTMTVQWNNSGSGTLSLIATHASGCDSAITIPVTINPKPMPVILGPTSSCVPTVETYSLSNPGSNSHNWSVTGGIVLGSTTGSSINVQWNSPGTGNISVTETNSFGCDSTVSISVSLTPYPRPILAGKQMVCIQDTAHYEVPFVPNHMYNWNVTGGTIIGPFTVTNYIEVYWFATGNGSVSVQQISPTGCDSTIGQTVRVNPKPAPAISGPTNICENQNYTYLTNPNNGSSYSWALNGGNIIGSSGQGSINVHWLAPGSGDVTLMETDSNGCINNSNISVQVQTRPNPVITGSNVGCMSQGINQYSAASQAGVIYQWSLTGGTIVTGNNTNNISVLWNSVGNFTITVHATNTITGCDSTASIQVKVDSMSAPVITASNFSGCSPLGVTFSGNNGNPNYTYHWTFGDGLSSAAYNPSHQYNNAGNYQVKLTATNTTGCKDSVSAQVQVYPTPVAYFNNHVSTDIYYTNTSPFTLENLSTGANQYLWNFGNGDTSVLFEPVYQYSGPGTYIITLVVINSYGCRDTIQSSIEIKVPENLYIPNAFTPNSDTRNENFSIKYRNVKDLNITIFNRWGQVVFASADKDFAWDGTFNGSFVQSGVYVYTLKATGDLGKYFERVGTVTVVR